MAVPEGPTDKRYTGNGVTKIFTIPFLLLSATDIDVFIDGVEISSGFTVTNVGYPTSTLTFAVAPDDQTDIYLQLDVPFERLNDYQENGDFLSSTVNRDFDRIWQALKQLLRWASRSLRLGYFDVDGRGWYQAKGNGIRDLHDPVNSQDAVTKKYADELTLDTTQYTDTQMLRTVRVSNGEILTQLPLASSRANKVMGFDAAGQPISVLPASGSGTELAIDLANPVDPSKGGGMVGLSYGGTVANALQHVVPLAPTSAAVFAAFEYAGLHGLSVEIPDGVYTGPDIFYSKPVSVVLRKNAFLNFGLELSGRDAMKSASVTLAGDFDAYPAGTTTFNDNFSAYTAGDIVMIELSNGGSQAYNEAGFDFAVVQSASSAQLVLTTGTRLAYRAPTISKLSNAARFTGALAKGSIDIPGDYAAQFSVGEMIRIENIDGVSGVEGSSFYFEFVKVTAVDAFKVALEARTQASYLNPWLIKVDALTDVSISGGRIRRLTAANNLELSLDRVRSDRQIVMKGYGHRIVAQESRGLGDPSTSNLTWVWNADVSTAKGGGSVGVTDNAALKFMSCPGLTLDGARGYNTKATAQGNYSVYIDFFYTPYKIWNSSVIAKNIRGVTPNGGSPRSVWMTGLENSTVDILGGQAFIQSSVDTNVVVQAAGHHLEIADLVGCAVITDCKTVSWQGCIDSTINGKTRDSQGTTTGNRVVWARASAGKHPVTGEVYLTGSNNEFNVSCLSSNPADTALYVQNQDSPLFGVGCRDKFGLLASITFGSGVTSPRMAPNFLRNEIPVSSSWVSARIKGYINFDGNYQDGGFIMDGNYVFVTSGKLRIHTARPTSSGVGVVVGSQS
ncbi:hypothetical protein GHN92_05035 [Pseudomonas sp. FSL R10-2964]|uniref:hypothetical protein n=1 Tax=Pseudomonas sp. FSL R10-2964 TaxID=2662202 RepID=UPI001294A87F|nr:hypothetical protein [Pseudomonas sp. FSL R10-2964]MQT83933.1 hypothetical protein [Pseudomonas sp. FSL R10-2964]